ncbi:MAG: 4,5-dihydroxyphthalate decarboxylase [Nitratireductor sp.]|nr:4,5-dihydroxyphthalate decarboxylase [Nitratireductor sp.]
MSKNLHLTLACGDYEIIRPLREGLVKADGIDLTFITNMDSTTRHWRFLRNREFDVAEVSASGYIAAKAAGQDLEAIPVFLHRRFRHGFIFTNSASGIRKPKDLIGRKVGVKSYIVTATLWLRGILEEHYGVPHQSIDWYSQLDEDVDLFLPSGLKLSKISEGKNIEDMLAEGEIDALLHPDIIKSIQTHDPRVGRLFKDHKAEEIAYFQRTGIFPIMHVTALKREIVQRHPWVAINLYKAFDASRRMAMQRMLNPRIVPLAWYREAWEEQEAILGEDPWAYGLGPQNRTNIETLARYSFEQGLSSRLMKAEDLFLPLDEGRGRGDASRY